MGPATLLGIDTPFHRWAAQNPSGSLDLLFLAVPVAALLTMALLVWRMAQYRRETAQRLALEHAVGRDAARLRALVTAVPDIVVRYDREGRYQEIFLSELVPLVSPPGELIGKLRVSTDEQVDGRSLDAQRRENRAIRGSARPDPRGHLRR